MARGWESKSVESQIEDSQLGTSHSERHPDSPQEAQRKRRKASLTLSRRHVLQQLEKSGDQRYSDLLRKALAELDTRIANLQ